METPPQATIARRRSDRLSIAFPVSNNSIGDVKRVMSRLKATILCIDDHWNGLIGRKMLLENNGYEVLEATGGEEGLKLFFSHSVDAVVLDYRMPGDERRCGCREDEAG
jgi:PleD family two-component response regulator